MDYIIITVKCDLRLVKYKAVKGGKFFCLCLVFNKGIRVQWFDHVLSSSCLSISSKKKKKIYIYTYKHLWSHVDCNIKYEKHKNFLICKIPVPYLQVYIAQ